MAIERIMAEGTPGPGPEGLPGGQQPALPSGVEGKSLPPASPEQDRQAPWRISPDYDPKRAGEYVKREEDGNYIYTDPATGKEVATVSKKAEIRGARDISSWGDLSDEERERITQEFPDQVERIRDFSPEVFKLWWPGFVRRQQAVQEAQANINAASGEGDSNPPAGGGSPPEEPPTGTPIGGSPEGPRIPEGRAELETSPEWGKRLVDEFLRYRLTMSYEVRYNAENGPRFKLICDQIQKYVDAVCKARNNPDPFGPDKEYPKPSPHKPGEKFEPPPFPPKDQAVVDLAKKISDLHDLYIIEGAGQSNQPKEIPYEALPQNTQGELISVDTLRTQYDRPSSREELLMARAQLDVYFRQAKRNGLLGEVDAELNNLFRDITRESMPPEQINAIWRNGITRASSAAMGELRDRMLDGVDVEPFVDVANAYIDMAVRAMERHLRGQRQPARAEVEWFIPVAEQARQDRRETYWETTSWPKYYHITAQTEEQFLIAKETFFQMIRTAGLGKSPDAVYEHIQNFIEAFKGAGGRQVQEGHLSNDFLMENRLELEALLFVFVGNYSNEVYNPDRRYEAMMAMSKDEGPARWVGLYRSGRGRVASFTEIFDMEALMDIYMNPVGERGELDIVAGHFLQDMIQEKVIERGMGIVLKDYDSREEYFSYDDLESKIHAARDLETIKSNLAEYKRGIRDGNLTLPADLQEAKRKEGVIEIKNGRIRLKSGYTAEHLLSERERARLNALKTNLRRLGLTKAHQDFRVLYEGFMDGDAHLKNYENYKKDQSEPEERRMFPSSLDAKDEKGDYIVPESIRNSINLGRIQTEVQALRQAIVEGKITPSRGQTAVDLLTPEDQEIYKAAYEIAKANFDVAFQMQGVLGEKGRRGRGFLYADRNQHIRFYFEVWDSLRLEGKSIDNQEEYRKLWDSFSAAQKRSFKIGQMLSKMRDGARLDSFSSEQQVFYHRLDPEDKADFVDNVPVYQAENFVQWGVFWTKMKYADDGDVWNERHGWKSWNDPIAQQIRKENKDAKKDELTNFKAKYRRAKVRETRVRLIEELRINGYQARMISDELVDGEPKIMIYKRPLGITDSVNGQFRKFKNGEKLGYNQAGHEVNLAFGPDGKLQGIEFDQNGQVVIYDKEADEKNAAGEIVPRKLVVFDTLNANTIARLDVQKGILVEETEATFQFAALSNDFRNRYTDHTYWYYQGNNRHTILADDVREAALNIRKGLSRPEDEDILATALLVIDPTGCRSRKLPDRNQQRELTMIAAAVLESFQDKQRTRHALHRAFLPKDGFEGRMQAGYRNEDWAGYDRFTMGFEEFAAQQPLRVARRGAAFIANVPMELDAAGPRWGVHGVGGAVKTMADEIKNIAHQGYVGQFGLTKVFEVMHKSVAMYEALVSHTDPKSGDNVFGLLEKPTDNNETMHKYTKEAREGKITKDPTDVIPFLYDFLKCFGRLQTLMHLMRVVETNNDNSAGAINLEEVDVFSEDGSYNWREIEASKAVRKNNGTARNRQYAFLYGEEDSEGYYDWLTDGRPGGGADMYDGEAYWNSFLHKEYPKFLGLKGEKKEYIKEWLTDKVI